MRREAGALPFLGPCKGANDGLWSKEAMSAASESVASVLLGTVAVESWRLVGDILPAKALRNRLCDSSDQNEGTGTEFRSASVNPRSNTGGRERIKNTIVQEC